MEIKRYKILDAEVDAINMKLALDFVDDAVRSWTSAGFIVAINPEKVYALRKDPFLRDFAKNAALLIPDGAGILLAGKILYGIEMQRCPGCDLMQAICEHAPQAGYRIFIYGASEEMNALACETLRKRYAGINIVGRANGFLKEDEMDKLVEQINDSRADILFIAMGSPKQEKWMSKYGSRLTTVKICQGIGGTLDVISGKVRRAPVAWQKLNLEWFYRLLCEPKRFKRQLNCYKFPFEVLYTKLFRKIY